MYSFDTVWALCFSAIKEPPWNFSHITASQQWCIFLIKPFFDIVIVADYRQTKQAIFILATSHIKIHTAKNKQKTAVLWFLGNALRKIREKCEQKLADVNSFWMGHPNLSDGPTLSISDYMVSRGLRDTQLGPILSRRRSVTGSRPKNPAV